MISEDYDGDDIVLTDDTRDDVRVRIVPDDQPPDGDVYGIILTVARGRVSVTHTNYGREGEGSTVAGALAWALERVDWDVAVRYLSMWYDVVSLDYFDMQGAKIVAVVTRGIAADDWGTPQDRWAGVATSCLSDWRAYYDGEVYGIATERRRTWVAADGTNDTMETWEQDDIGAVGGYFGQENTVAEARSMLAGEVKALSESA